MLIVQLICSFWVKFLIHSDDHRWLTREEAEKPAHINPRSRSTATCISRVKLVVLAALIASIIPSILSLLVAFTGIDGKNPPSCDKTNLVSARYVRRTDYDCTGIYPSPMVRMQQMFKNAVRVLQFRQWLTPSRVIVQKGN
ncbi:hypothetical protein EYZ11_010357 [Aspergillus tanneri]|uniref:Uncharacterized protein n=1 Tax=Aspergillus tanneri TaxID=1220188 RepID=A0A4S3J5K2_9EURO|nr:hypothetical protein EYZ11_010357 [Aspergillus tanneri]